jgi:oligopeptidase A
MATAARPAALRDIAELETFAGRKLDAWDISYYSERLQEAHYSVSQEELRQYFPLPRVLDGVFDVIQRLFHVSIAVRDDVEVWHPDARYYDLRNANGQIIGGFYLDPYARPNKRSGAWMDDCVTRKVTPAGNALPVAYLVCNALPGNSGKPALLTHDDVVTLFHEFGHGLHHMLTRVDYPSVAGTNGVAWDAIELPSQFLENYAWDPQVLAQIAVHHATGEALPAAKVAQLIRTRSFQAGLATLRQCEFSLFDFRLHAEYDPARGARIAEILAEVRREVSDLVIAGGAKYFAAMRPQRDLSDDEHREQCEAYAEQILATYRLAPVWIAVLLVPRDNYPPAMKEGGYLDDLISVAFAAENLMVAARAEVVGSLLLIAGANEPLRNRQRLCGANRRNRHGEHGAE